VSEPVVGFLLTRSKEPASPAGRNNRTPVKSSALTVVITRCHAVAEAGCCVCFTVFKSCVLLHGPTIAVYSRITDSHNQLCLSLCCQKF